MGEDHRASQNFKSFLSENAMTDENKMTAQLKGRVVMLSAALAQSNRNMLMLINALKMTTLSARQQEFIQQASAQLAASKNTLAKADEK